jgi:integrase
MKQRADGRWVKTVTIGGKRVFFYSIEPTEKKAIADINRQLLAYQDEQHKAKHNFGAIVNVVLEKKEREVEDATYKSYLYASYKLRDLFAFDIEDITPLRFSSLLEELAAQKYSRSGIAKVKVLASLVCDEAILNGINVQNFAAGTKIPKKAKKAEQKDPITDEEIKVIYDNVDKPFGMFPFLLIFTGMRKGEALALQKRDIDFDKNLIFVTKAVTFPVNQAEIKATKTASSVRAIPIMPILHDRLKAYVSNMKASDYLFGGDTPISKTAVVKRWAQYAKATGINATPHQLRHTFSYLQYRSGTDAKTLQGLLGHSNVQTSLNIYTKFNEQVSKASMDKANDLSTKITFGD